MKFLKGFAFTIAAFAAVMALTFMVVYSSVFIIKHLGPGIGLPTIFLLTVGILGGAIAATE